MQHQPCARYAKADKAMSFERWYADEPDKLRVIIPPGLTCITRRREDDPAVKETWL